MNPKRSPHDLARRRARGFSLIEVLVAVLILGVAMTGLTRGITMSLQSSRDAERHTTAVFLAESRIETLRAEGDFIEGEQTGEFEGVPGYGWRESIRSAGSEGLYAVRVDVLPAPKSAAPAAGATAGAARSTSPARSAPTSSSSRGAQPDGAAPGTPASRPYFTLETLLFKKPIASTLSSSGEETETERRRRRGEESQGRRREMR